MVGLRVGCLVLAVDCPIHTHACTHARAHTHTVMHIRRLHCNWIVQMCDQRGCESGKAYDLSCKARKQPAQMKNLALQKAVCRYI